MASAKTINMGLYENPPLSFTDIKTKKEKGLFVDILKELTQKNNLGLNFVHCKFSQCLKLLKNGNMDILGPIAYSPTRTKHILFLNENILSNWGVVYTNNKIKLKNFTKLANKKIGLLKNDIYTKAFIKMAKEFNTKIKTEYFDSYFDMFKAIKDKKIFAGVGGRLLEYSMHDKYSSIKESGIIFKPTNITFALNKNDKNLKDMLDNSIINFKLEKKSQYYAILNQYLTIKTANPYLKWITVSVLILIIFVLALLYINKLLKSRVKKATKELVETQSSLEKNLDNQLYLTNIIETVKDVNQILIENGSVEDKLNHISRKITKNLLYSFCLITHIDEYGLTKIVAKSKCGEEKREDLKHFFKAKSVFDNLLLNTAYADKKSFIQSAKNLKPFANGTICDFSYVISTPIFTNDNLSHIITLFSNNPKGFNEREVSLINELGGDIGLLLSMEKHKQDKEKSYEEMIASLNRTVEARDPYTAGHDERVQKYSLEIAKNLNLSKKEMGRLKKASIIHDIGKIKIPDAILLKPSKLSKIEYDIVKEHPKAAYNMLKDVSFLKEEIDIILHHHERCDGSGYPDGLKGEEIPLLSQVLSIADTFDAMTTNRIYKHAKNISMAIEELESLRDIHFCSKVLDAAIKYFQKVNLDKDIYQMPLNALEEARFSYFFKDSTTNCYNKNFLKYLFIENRVRLYNSIFAINLKNFTAYNSIFGWEKGDDFLANFANLLKNKFQTDKIFRVKGDDFIIFTKNNLSISKLDILKDKMFENKIATIGFQKIDTNSIKSVDNIKEIIRKL